MFQFHCLSPSLSIFQSSAFINEGIKLTRRIKAACLALSDLNVLYCGHNIVNFLHNRICSVSKLLWSLGKFANKRTLSTIWREGFLWQHYPNFLEQASAPERSISNQVRSCDLREQSSRPINRSLIMITIISLEVRRNFLWQIKHKTCSQHILSVITFLTDCSRVKSHVLQWWSTRFNVGRFRSSREATRIPPIGQLGPWKVLHVKYKSMNIKFQISDSLQDTVWSLHD